MNWKLSTFVLGAIAIVLALFLLLRPADTQRVVVRDTVTDIITERVVDTVPRDLSDLRGEVAEMRSVLPEHHPAYQRALDDIVNTLPEGQND